MNGWIKLHRRILECFLWLDSEPFCKRAAWIDLLLLANHRENKILIDGKPVVIKRGQYHTSIYKLATRWKWDRRKVARFLDVLENDRMLAQQRTTNGTTITIANYDVYQDCGTTDGTTNGTTDGTTDGTQTRNKERKNVKNNYKSKITFHNFDMKHDYDFDEVERKLLNGL